MPFPSMPGPPQSPVVPWPVLLRIKDTLEGSYIAEVQAFGVNETDGGYDRPLEKSVSDGSVIVDCANMSNWETTDNDFIRIELTKDNRNAVVFENISKATVAARFAAYPIITELRNELPERIAIVGDAIAGRRIIGRNRA